MLCMAYKLSMALVNYCSRRPRKLATYSLRNHESHFCYQYLLLVHYLCLCPHTCAWQANTPLQCWPAVLRYCRSEQTMLLSFECQIYNASPAWRICLLRIKSVSRYVVKPSNESDLIRNVRVSRSANATIKYIKTHVDEINRKAICLYSGVTTVDSKQVFAWQKSPISIRSMMSISFKT